MRIRADSNKKKKKINLCRKESHQKLLNRTGEDKKVGEKRTSGGDDSGNAQERGKKNFRTHHAEAAQIEGKSTEKEKKGPKKK